MFEKLTKLFSDTTHSTTDVVTYKKPSELGKQHHYSIIPSLEIPTNNKPNILIMDDNLEAGEVTVLDFKQIDDIAKKIREGNIKLLSKKQQEFIETLPNKILCELTKFKLDDYNIILATGTMAAFSVLEAVDNGLRVDYAVLDILIGGYNVYKGKQYMPDGIDVVKHLKQNNPNIRYYFYSGCSLSLDSDETHKFHKITGDDLRHYTIDKDKNLFNKKQKIISLFVDGGK